MQDTKTTHEPAPWTARNPILREVDARIVGGIERPTDLLVLIWEEGADIATAEADRDLITAAPEMLAALYEVLAFEADTGAMEGEPALDQIRAAIAKAEGGAV
jgi:hypothetical protein